MSTTTPKAFAHDPDCVSETITLNSGQRLVFRPLKSDDSDLLAGYFKSLSPSTRKLYGPHPFTSEQAKKLCAGIDCQQVIRLVAVTDNIQQPEIVAYFILGFTLSNADKERYRVRGMNLDQASVCTIAPSVADAYQNRRLGSIVMNRTLALARNLGKNQVILQGGVQAANSRAVHFYRKLGFRKVGSFSTTIENYDMILDLTQNGKTANTQ